MISLSETHRDKESDEEKESEDSDKQICTVMNNYMNGYEKKISSRKQSMPVQEGKKL
jgi:hypothetical protein